MLRHRLRDGAGEGSASIILTAGIEAEDGKLSFVEDVLFGLPAPDGGFATVSPEDEAASTDCSVCQRAEWRATTDS